MGAGGHVQHGRLEPACTTACAPAPSTPTRPCPQSLFDSWPITVDGEVNSPYTALLPDLVKEAEAAGVTVTKVSKEVCNWNGTGAGSVSNVEITGIPVSWLIERAGGYADNADINGVRVMRADGSSKRAMPLDKVDGGEAFLVYKINGEQLTAANGFPCTNWCEGVDPEVNSKQMNEYKVVTDAPRLRRSRVRVRASRRQPERLDRRRRELDEQAQRHRAGRARGPRHPERPALHVPRLRGRLRREDRERRVLDGLRQNVDEARPGRHRRQQARLVRLHLDASGGERLLPAAARHHGKRPREPADPNGHGEREGRDAAADETVVIDTPSLVAPKTAAAEVAEGKE